MALFAFISAILFAFALLSTSIAEIVTIKHLGKDNAKLLANRPKSLFEYRFSPPLGAGSVSDGTDDLELLDVVLLASVDGKLHALNRTSGRLLWSMSSGSSSTIPRTLAPLVRTSHVDSDPDLTDDDNVDQELYIIEPQSGDIYVLSSPLSPLKRLSLSMPQLVDLSPFTFSSDDDRRVFEGKKETSLLLIDLETGRVKDTMNSECPWDPFEDLHESANERESDGSDGQSGDKSAVPPREPLEIYIGRTGS
jgi:serine/threonine-protein kinase/endoribonuclease IRE1